MPVLVPIVEGDGEVAAVPLLLRNILHHHALWDWRVGHPKRAGGLQALKKNPGRFIQLALYEEACGAILVLLDLDDGCPREEACQLAQAIRAMNPPCPVAVVLAHCEYEAWFLASLESIRGKHGLPADLVFDGDVETKRGAKEWLSNAMPRGTIYKETIDQAKFTQSLDFSVARTCSRSFRRLWHAIEELVQTPQPGASVTPCQ